MTLTAMEMADRKGRLHKSHKSTGDVTGTEKKREKMPAHA